jgi:hypothetical protein
VSLAPPLLIGAFLLVLERAGMLHHLRRASMAGSAQ